MYGARCAAPKSRSTSTQCRALASSSRAATCARARMNGCHSGNSWVVKFKSCAPASCNHRRVLALRGSLPREIGVSGDRGAVEYLPGDRWPSQRRGCGSEASERLFSPLLTVQLYNARLQKYRGRRRKEPWRERSHEGEGAIEERGRIGRVAAPRPHGSRSIRCDHSCNMGLFPHRMGTDFLRPLGNAERWLETRATESDWMDHDATTGIQAHVGRGPGCWLPTADRAPRSDAARRSRVKPSKKRMAKRRHP